MEKSELCSFANLRNIQRGATVGAPGSVNMRRKNCVFLPAAGRITQLFHLIFTEPRANHKVHPCPVMFCVANRVSFFNLAIFLPGSTAIQSLFIS